MGGEYCGVSDPVIRLEMMIFVESGFWDGYCFGGLYNPTNMMTHNNEVTRV